MSQAACSWVWAQTTECAALEMHFPGDWGRNKADMVGPDIAHVNSANVAVSEFFTPTSMQ